MPLHSEFLVLNAKMGAFGQWEVPLYFTSILDEHEAVRTRSGLFDISHMGEFKVRGRGALAFLQKLLPRDLSRMENGQALYMPMLDENGGVIDDVIVYRSGPQEYFLIVNAGNVDKDSAWVSSHVTEDVHFENLSEHYGLLAFQGPEAALIIERLFGSQYAALRYYRFAPFRDGFISRTGYTGEDGFEICVAKSDVPKLWQDIRAAGQTAPIGFGARDTLRLEAGMLLCGHDMNEDTTPLEAGISWALDLSKPDFIGLAALRKQQSEGVKRKMAGFILKERGIPREGYGIQKNGRIIGKVTSGAPSPTLKENIGLGYIEAAEAVLGSEIEIIIRGRSFKAIITTLPFYKRKKHSS